MASYNVGWFIRNQRINKKLTQEQLAEGACCTAVTLSRIENGQQTPSKNQVERIMQRLGLSAEKFFNVFLSGKEYASFQKKEELYDYLRRNDMEKAKKMVAELEQDKAFQNNFYKQFLLSSKASILLHEERDYEEALNLLHNAIKITIPNYDEKMIKTYMLTFEEIVIVDKIALVYPGLGDIGRAVDVLYDLKTSSDKAYVDDDEKARTYPMIIYHLTKYLLESKRYDEAIPLCEEGARLGIKCNKLELLPYIVYNKACCLYGIGNIEPCKELFTQAYYALKLIGKFKVADIVKTIAIKRYDIEIG